ncbi:MAG: hypothetical protein EB126_10845 [Synechococcaceae bacterium WBB_10_009]|nr:hypothetical protein [Synechococcaceae bacterium WBB_10_009]
MVHGLLDTPTVFNRLRQTLGGRAPDLLIPALPLRMGLTSVAAAADQLARQIEARYPGSTPLDLLGFSIGGVIARTWIQRLGGHRRTRRFVSLGSPQQGTLAAQLVPSPLLAGIADMKVGSRLLRQLDSSVLVISDPLH